MKEITETISDILGGIFGGLWDSVYSLFVHAPTPKYNARFEDTGDYFSTRATGITPNGTLYADLSTCYEGTFVSASSGAGKSTVVGYPSVFRLAETGVSMIILDFGGGYLKKTSGRVKELGYIIREFNPSKPGTSKFNLLDLCKNKILTQEYLALYMSNAKVESKSDPFWGASCVQATTLFIDISRTLPKSEQHLGTVLRLLEDFAADPRKIDPIACRSIPLLFACMRILLWGERSS